MAEQHAGMVCSRANPWAGGALNEAPVDRLFAERQVDFRALSRADWACGV